MATRRAASYIFKPIAQSGRLGTGVQLIVPWIPSAIAAFLTSSPAVFFLAAAVTVVILAGNAVLKLATEVEQYERAPRPYLRLDKTQIGYAKVGGFVKKATYPGFDPTPLGASYGGTLTMAAASATADAPYEARRPIAQEQQLPTNVAAFARILVTNKPPPGFPPLTAEGVGATARLYDAERKFLHEWDGRWSASLQEHERQQVGLELEHLEATIPGNGKARPLDIAMKYPSDRDMYIYNDDNSRAPDARYKPHRLTDARYFVEVTLRAANHGDEVEARFQLTNPGSGKQIELVPITADGA